MIESNKTEPKGKQKSRLHITHAQNDARYIALGKTLVLSKSEDYEEELAKMNKKKNGAPFLYADSLFLSLATIRSFCNLSFRVLAGFAAASIGEDNAPGYRQIHRRMGSIKVSIKDNIITARNKKSTINLSIDGTGLSPNARSEYIRYRHKVKHGFIRVVFVVDTDTREILAFSVTDETIGEPPQFEPLVCTALKNIGADEHIVETTEEKCEEEKDQMPCTVDDEHIVETTEEKCEEEKDQMPCTVNDTQDSTDKIDPETHTPQSTDVEVLNKLNVIMRADGGFDSREIFKLCKQLKITPYIRIKHNAVTRSRGVSRDRSIAVLDQLGGGITNPSDFAQLTKDEREDNRKKWKKRVDYGMRWIVEIIISSFKRLFGDSVAARKWDYIVQEINLKVCIYNNMLRVQQRAIDMA